MTKVRGAGAVAPLVVLAIALALGILSDSPLAAARQEDPLAPPEIGAGPVRERSLAFVGRTVYADGSAALYGYFTAVIGLDSALLFTDASPSAETARFTYVGDVSLSSSVNRGDVTMFDGDGTMRIYFDDDAGASWDDPGSFADGEPVAEFEIRMHDTLQRQAPGVGVVVGDSRLGQSAAAELDFDGKRFRFGQSGIEGRLRYVGALVNGGANAQASNLVASLTGSVAVVAREAIPVPMGGPTP
ncbi:MAG: hypothetical protein ACRDJC_11175 [Thermomicrobiales bacterium]